MSSELSSQQDLAETAEQFVKLLALLYLQIINYNHRHNHFLRQLRKKQLECDKTLFFSKRINTFCQFVVYH